MKKRGQFRHAFLSLVLLGLGTRTPCSVLAVDPLHSMAGGAQGFTEAGIDGDYYPTPDLSGSLAFTRHDIRIDFDFFGQKPGGSNAPGFADVSANQFSVRWTGQIIPRYSEPYLFRTVATGVRVFIRPESAGDWKVLIDAWNGSDDTTSPIYQLSSGSKYDIKVEFRQVGGGAASVHLYWKSPSTPEEIIGPLGSSGTNVNPYIADMLADTVKSGRWWFGSGPWGVIDPNLQDINGWPKGDFEKVLWEGDSLSRSANRKGTYLLQFNGQAEMDIWPFSLRYTADGKDYTGFLPAGAGYDSATNLTTAIVHMDSTTSIAILRGRKTKRTATSAVGTGITDIRLMEPLTPGGTTYYPVNTFLTDNYRKFFKRYTTLRFTSGIYLTGTPLEVDWKKDRSPGDFIVPFEVPQKVSWEAMIQLANELGRDPYIEIPVSASDDYFRKLALVLKYGSDGYEPYTSFQANPVYPGLNSNLKVYVEYACENWNFSFANNWFADAQSTREISQKTVKGLIINFDGKAPDRDYRRWTALQMVYASNAFRAVWGDAAMGNEVRFLYEYQYDNANDTATNPLNFVNNYFNNGDGQPHVKEPHPVSYYFWGGGAAAYFGATNETGFQTDMLVDDYGFEKPVLNDGEEAKNTTGSAWTFTGDSGIYRNGGGTPIIQDQTLGASESDTRAIGIRFTVGASKIFISGLGRWIQQGNSKVHALHLIRAADNFELAHASIDASDASKAPPGGYAYGGLSSGILALAAGTSYYVVSEEVKDGDSYYDRTTMVTQQDPSITIDGPAVGGGPNGSKWTMSFPLSGGGPQQDYGPVNFQTVPSAALGDLGNPLGPQEGSQAAFIGPGGSVSIPVNISKTGVLAFHFYAYYNANGLANDPKNSNPGTGAHFFLDNKEITANNATSDGFRTGYYAHPGDQWQAYGTNVINVSTPGTHVFKIVANINPNWAPILPTFFFDRIEINTADAIFASKIPYYTFGTLNHEQGWAESYGLHDVLYETSWALGGDFEQIPLQTYAKCQDPRAVDVHGKFIDDVIQAGGNVNVTAYPQCGPQLQANDNANNSLPPDITNGIPFTNGWKMNTWTNLSLGYVNGLCLQASNAWMSYNAIVKQTGTYDLTVNTVAGGRYEVIVDGSYVVIPDGVGGSPSKVTLYLTQGLHSVRFQSLDRSVCLTSEGMTASLTPTYSILGPSHALFGQPVNFLVTPNAPFIGSVSLSDQLSGSGTAGTFSPVSVTWSGTTDAQTVTYQPGSMGKKIISGSNTAAGVANPDPVALVIDLGGDSGGGGGPGESSESLENLLIDPQIFERPGSNAVISVINIPFDVTEGAVYNIRGEKQKNFPVSSGSALMDVTNLASGRYVLSFKKSDGSRLPLSPKKRESFVIVR